MSFLKKKEKIYIGNCCGNSFVVFDCRNIIKNHQTKVDDSIKFITKYQVDSALFINRTDEYDFFVEIFEKDGSESDACGNGIILITFLFNIKKGLIRFKNSIFEVFSDNEKQILYINEKFFKIAKVINKDSVLFIKAGEEPHLIYLENDIYNLNLEQIGSDAQKDYPNGVNVNLLQKVNDSKYLIRTYERGVYSETKSCGTGSLSSFLAISYFTKKRYTEPIEFESRGGKHWIYESEYEYKLETLKEFCKIKPLRIWNII